MGSEVTRVVESLSFCHQQELANIWAVHVKLSRFDCEWFASRILSDFGVESPTFLWEQPALTGSGNEACTTRNLRTSVLTVTFNTHGTDLLTLCHELVHVVRPWEEPHHDAFDWDLCSLMLELVREELG